MFLAVTGVGGGVFSVNELLTDDNGKMTEVASFAIGVTKGNLIKAEVK